LPADELKLLIKQHDVDLDGTINFKDFKLMFARSLSQQSPDPKRSITNGTIN
jgi:Ca2+-binding EF-hand superfamily protein